MHIVVSEFIDQAALNQVGSGATVDYDPELVENRPRLLDRMRLATGLIVRNRTQVDGELLAAAPHLKVVGRLGVGLDNIDLKACEARNIAVHPATGANTLPVAEYVITASLMLLRGAFVARGAMIAGDWPRSALIGGETSGRVMGLLGFGAIARAVADRARSLGMTILAHDPFLAADDPAWQHAQTCSLKALLAQADVLSLHVPITATTRNLIDAEALARMKPSAIVINTARGGIVDEAALAHALRHKTLAAAALDVFDQEPLTAASAAKFDGLDNILLTPHIAGVSTEANIRVSAVTVTNVLNELRSLNG